MASGRPPGVTGRRQPRPSVRVVPSGCRAHSTRSPPANGTACGVAWPRTTAANPFADDGLRTRAPRGRPARGRIPGRSTPGGIRPSPTAPPTRPRPGTPLSTGTSAASTASAAAEPFVGRTGGTAEEQGGRHAQDVEVELGWGLRTIPTDAVVVALRGPCSPHLPSLLTVGIDLGKRWAAWW
jgi:hypothetical protein